MRTKLVIRGILLLILCTLCMVKWDMPQGGTDHGSYYGQRNSTLHYLDRIGH